MYKIKQTENFDIIEIQQKDIQVSLMDYGATIKQIKTPDKNGKLEDILLEYQKDKDYLNNSIYLNGTIGPIAGRIKDGLLQVEDRSYHFTKNQNHQHTLHSGDLALTFQTFDYEIKDSPRQTIVKFSLEKMPFSHVIYQIYVIYTISEKTMDIDYQINTTQPFIFNLTNHAYFNLSGDLKSNISHHILQITSKKRHQLDQDLISTSKILEEKIYDFTKPKTLNEPLNKLKHHAFGGYDDIYYFPDSQGLSLKAIAADPISQRKLKVYSTYNHMVFYTHNNINQHPLKHLGNHKKHYALCFECQRAPLAFKNKKNSITRPNESYREKIRFVFDLIDINH